MIRSLKINEFKCYDNFTTNLTPLTVLAGVNGVGKSSFVQAFLLFYSALLNKTLVPLNSDIFSIGMAEEIVPHRGGCPCNFSVEAKWGENEIRADFEAKDNSDRVLSVKLSDENFQFSSFAYLGADRVGPMVYNARQSQNKDTMSIGRFGEFCAEVLSLQETSSIGIPGLVCPKFQEEKYPSTLIKQVEVRMRMLGFNLQIKPVVINNLLGISAIEFMDDISGDWISPTHTGYGISYALPLIVAGLTAKAGGVLIIDSPEAHLHPAAQSAIGQFLALLAQNGVQVIAETHSDHVINGVRLASMKGEIDANKVTFLSFKREQNTVVADAIRIEENGALSAWPEGFFSQIETDMAEIVRLKRTRGK